MFSSATVQKGLLGKALNGLLKNTGNFSTACQKNIKWNVTETFNIELKDFKALRSGRMNIHGRFIAHPFLAQCKC